MREPQLKEKVKIADSEKVFVVESVFFNEVTLVECRCGRGEKEKRVVDISQLIYLKEEKIKKEKKAVKQYKDAPPVKITREQRGQILKNLVEEDSIRDNFKREIMVLARLIRKFPHIEFLLEGFKPVIKAKSLLYWINRPEVEQMYRSWAIDISLTKTQEKVILSSEKIGEDIITKKTPRNLLDLLG